MLLELSTFFFLFVLSFSVALLLYLPSIRYDINLGDEGYLWHGVLETLDKKIPIRDFRAYDFGRYYWCAFWMFFLGRDIIALRICLLITRIFTLFISLLILSIFTPVWYQYLILSLLIGLWMHPRHKQIDILMSVVVILIAVVLLSNPIPFYYFLSGFLLGNNFNHGIKPLTLCSIGIFYSFNIHANKILWAKFYRYTFILCRWFVFE